MPAILVPVALHPSLTVSRYYNNTYLYDESPQCGSLSTNECIAIRGGAFDESSSSTLTNIADASDLESLDSQAQLDANPVLSGTDTLTINGTFQVEKYPFAIPRSDRLQFMDWSQLGLGKDSSLLTMLRNQGSIASRTFSLYWGQTGISPDHQLEGNLVLGGLDLAKATGKNHTTSIKRGSACPSGLLVSVSDITLEFPNGTSASIMAGGVGQSLNYCLAPEYPIITMPWDLWEKWMNAYPQMATDANAHARAAGQPNLWGLVFPPDLM